MNRLRVDVLRRLSDAFESGASIRSAARIAGCSPITARKYLASGMVRGLCGCGSHASHQGWCSFRFNNSSARMEWMHSFNPPRNLIIARTKRPYTKRSRWTFTPLPPDRSPLLDLIAGFIPTSLPRQVRDEAIQDIAVAVLSAEITEGEIGSIALTYVHSVLKQFPMRYGPISIDQPRGGDNRPLKMFL